MMEKQLHAVSLKKEGKVPQHVAIIMDGNGRWAKARGLPRSIGHQKGAEAVRQTLLACRDVGVKYLTLYAFSQENWKRPADEVKQLMQLLRYYLQHELTTLHKNNVCLKVIGDRAGLAEDIAAQITQAEQYTGNNTGLYLYIALNYGSRQEIVHAARMLARQVKEGELSVEHIDEATFENALYTANIPSPDLYIRTSGEKRLSNFLLWQSAYTELFFTDKLWPDFKKEDFLLAIQEYMQRERRYGSS